jgi:hypothetical protein
LIAVQPLPRQNAVALLSDAAVLAIDDVVNDFPVWQRQL